VIVRLKSEILEPTIRQRTCLSYRAAVYVTLKANSQHSSVVKGSEFLAFAAKADDVKTALGFVQAIRQQRPDATHVCWAYKIFDQYRFSDDGEPGGTAGAPIFRALEGSGLECVVVAVVRYYGGTNLGAGGLVRAYGGTAAEALRIAERLEVHPRIRVSVQVGFEQMSTLYKLLEDFDTAGREDDFTDQGLRVQWNALETELEPLRIAVRDATRGQGSVGTG
jgi:uncharacterized YigZ family protein